MTNATSMPLGLCQCGCGEQTPLAKKTNPERGLIKGQPTRFLPGHQTRLHIKPVPNARSGSGLCECGCGQRTPIASRSDRRGGVVKGQPLRFIHGHNGVGSRNARYRGGQCYNKATGRWEVTVNGKRVLRARAVAEQSIGRPLRPGEVVHHINGDRTDDRPENLMVVPDQAQHMILHRKYSDEELLGAVQLIAEKLGRRPTFLDLCDVDGAPNPATVKARFGTWNKALEIAGCAN